MIGTLLFCHLADYYNNIYDHIQCIYDQAYILWCWGNFYQLVEKEHTQK